MTRQLRSARTVRLAADERGFALPISLFLVLAAFAIVSVAILESVQAQSGTTRDQQSKAAVQAAEAGVSDALLRYNTYSSSAQPLTPGAPCINQSGVPSLMSNGWCSEVDVNGGGGTARYWVRFPTPSTLEVFSVGYTNSSVTRRVDAILTSAAQSNPFANAAVRAQAGLTLDAQSQIHAGAQSGTDITVLSSAKQCGAATVGQGHRLTTAASGAYYLDTGCTVAGNPVTVPQQSLTLPPVNQGDAPTNNNDVNITNAVNGTGPPTDLISGRRTDVTWTGAGTGPGQRQLSIGTNTSLTLTGTKYSLCSLTLGSNSAIYVTAGLNTTIFFDSPEACGMSPDRTGVVTQLSLQSNSRISYTLGAPASVALLFVGSQATPPTPTSFLLNSNTGNDCTQNFVVYAPKTDITLDSNSNYCGAMAGQTVYLRSNAKIFTDSQSTSFQLPNTPPHYVVSKLVECTAAGPSPQPAGC